ncbi:MAG: hypothetical protein ACYTFA_03435 [Planctomycetota bacterium]|jgi:hypothetical protein
MAESTMVEEPMEAYTDIRGDEEAERDSEGSLVEEAVANARCAYCGDNMVRGKLPKFNRGFGIVVLILGLMLSVFMLLLLGLPMVVIGAYMTIASRSVWACPACRAVVDRNAA